MFLCVLQMTFDSQPVEGSVGLLKRLHHFYSEECVCVCVYLHCQCIHTYAYVPDYGIDRGSFNHFYSNHWEVKNGWRAF